MVLLAEIPMTPNGKLDRRALPAPGPDEVADHASPTTAIERQLLTIWADVLGLRETQISIDSDFFAIGGHSLSAINLVSRIHKELHAKLPLKHVFEMPTIRRLALHLQGVEKQEYISIEVTEQKEYYALSSAQRRMFILQQLDPLSKKYNMPYMLPLGNEVNREKLENAFRKLMVRHEILRTSIGIVNHEPVQFIHDNVEFSLQYHEIAADGLDREEGQGGIEAAVKEVLRHFVRPFDLSRPPFLRAALIHTGPDGHILAIDMHHTISDERTMEIITEEIKTFYNDNELPSLRLQYKDYARWQSFMCRGDSGHADGILKQQEIFWLKKFAGDLPILDIPTDYPRPEVQDFSGGYIFFEIHRQHTHAVSKLAASLNATVYMVLLAVYNILLAKLSGQEDIVIGTPVTGRRHSELDKLVGMFINMLPMRNFPEMKKTFEAFLTEVKANALADFDNQDYPFDELVAKLGIKKASDRSPLYDAAFLFQSPKTSIMEDTGAEEPPGDFPGHEYKTTFSKDDFQHNISYAELGLFSYQSGDRIRFEFKYHSALFKQETVEKMAQYYKNILEQVTVSPGIRLADLQLFGPGEYNGFTGVEIRAEANISQSKEKIEADFEF
jgi:acyl carrier protein